MFKKGQKVKCAEAYDDRLTVGKEYEVVDVDHDSDLAKVRVICDKGIHAWFLGRRFETLGPITITLSDFDRIRLETAARLKEKASWISAEIALSQADELITLIMDNPFKRSE